MTSMATNMDMRPRWKTAAGEDLLPEQMGDRHLDNAIRYALRNGRNLAAAEANAAWWAAGTFTGEMATYYAERDATFLDELAYDSSDEEVRHWVLHQPIVVEMLRERSRRRRARKARPCPSSRRWRYGDEPLPLGPHRPRPHLVGVKF